MKITLISDTHTRHRSLDELNLPGGDLLIHAGDLMNSGYIAREAIDFMDWFASQSQYDKKIFIAGNHDRLFENDPDFIQELLQDRPRIEYLQDEGYGLYSMDEDRSVKIYGSPWQPEFYNWAFNLPREGAELEAKWNAIPEDTDILITHGPARGHLDTSGPPYNEPNLGCPLLTKRIQQIKPKIHVCGHIHGGYGYKFEDGTHFFNASVLNERYVLVNEPFTFDWDPITNQINW